MNTRFLLDSFLNALIERAVVKKREASREEIEALISCLAPYTAFGADSDAVTLCEQPTGMETVEDDGCIQLPNNSLASSCASMLIKAHGKSMTGGSIKEGDSLMVKKTDKAHDGDKVVAFVDGELTCAVLVRKDNGCGMLLPCNPDYKSIVLDGEYLGNLIIVGVITDIVPNVTDADAAAMRERAQKLQFSVPSEEKVANMVRRIRSHVKCKRLWYSVFNVLRDCRYYAPNDYRGFVNDLKKWLGANYKLLPDPHDLSKLSVLSFSKPYWEWDRDNAPVRGKTFDKYCDLAFEFWDMLFE